MSEEIPADINYQVAQSSFEADQIRLEEARQSQAAPHNRVGQFLADRRVISRERSAYESDQHLGMIDTQRAIREAIDAGEDPVTVIARFA